MRVVHTIREMREAKQELQQGGVVGLVPTMGALHEGHLALVREMRSRAAAVVVSIFVNPTQFGPNEDFNFYPRTFDADCAALKREGVDIVFAPSPEEMYPAAAVAITVDPGPLGERLDGQFRPGHFRGVATVVCKLLHIVQPDAVIFGQKDAAQVAVLRAMVRALNFPLDFLVHPIVRDQDGLALSSRNRYLSAAERHAALILPETLRMVETMVKAGSTSAEDLKISMLMKLAVAEGVQLEYAEIVDPGTLLPKDDVSDGALVAIAVRVGATRLIDNTLLLPGDQP